MGLMGHVVREDAGAGRQQPLIAQPRDVRGEGARVEVVGLDRIGAIGMVQRDEVEAEPPLMEGPSHGFG